MDIKERLQNLQTRKADNLNNAPPKPTTQAGPGKEWRLTEDGPASATYHWEARPAAEPDPTKVKQVVTKGSVKEQWAHYSSQDDSLFVAAEWNPVNPDDTDWDADTIRKEVLEHVAAKHGATDADFVDLDWESGFALVRVNNARQPKQIEAYAELKGDEVTCPIDEQKVEVKGSCMGVGAEPCPFLIKREASHLCSFKQFGSQKQPTSLDQYIEANKHQEKTYKIAHAILESIPMPKIDRRLPALIAIKDDHYKPVQRLAMVMSRQGSKGMVTRKNKDGSWRVKWDGGTEGIYWAQELNVIE